MRRHNNLWALLLITCLVIGVAAGLYNAGVHANATDTLTFKVGYYGWPASDYIEKKVYTASEIKELSETDLLAYTYYDGTGHRIAIDSAHGAYLDTLLDDAGIDRGSISTLAFYTTDSGDGAFATFTMQELVLTDRYYFQDLAEYIGRDGKYIDSDAKRILWNQATQVGVALAYEDKWVWYQAETEGAGPTDSGMNTQNRFRLCFGQSNPLDYRTFQSARMVETIYVMFSGSPELSAEESNIDGKIGSTHSLKITAAAADDELAARMLEDLTFESSDESVVSVDGDGNLQFNQEGDAVITVSSGGSTLQIGVHVGKEEEEEEAAAEPEPEPEPEQEKTPAVEKKDNDKKDKSKNNGKGKAKGKGQGASNGNGPGTAKGSNTLKRQTPAVQEQKQKQEQKREQKIVYVLSDDAGKKLKSALINNASAEEASMNTYQKPMDSDAEQLKIKDDSKDLLGAMGLINGIFAAEGSIFGFIRFRRQRFK